MVELVEYMRGVIASPTKTVASFIKEKKLLKYFVILFILNLVINNVFLYLLKQQYTTFPAPGSIAYILDKTYAPYRLPPVVGFVLSLLLQFLPYGIVHIICRVFSKKGSFLQLITTGQLILVSFMILSLPFDIAHLYYKIKVFSFISSSINLWSFYLGVVAISIIYSISKKKAFLSVIIPFISLGVVSAVILGYAFLQYYK